MREETFKEADLAITNCHNHYSNLTMKLRTFTHLEHLARMCKLNAVCTAPLVLSKAGIISDKLHVKFTHLEHLTRMCKLNAVCTAPLVLSKAGIISDKLHVKFIFYIP
jgi:hypothetical protein